MHLTFMRMLWRLDPSVNKHSVIKLRNVYYFQGLI